MIHTPPHTVRTTPQVHTPAMLRLWPYRLAGLASLQFVLLTALAMRSYPGGTNVDHLARGYSFLHNFFSDLGLTVAHNGQPNTVSATLFVIALVSIGLSLVGFALTLPQLFRGHVPLYRLSLAGSIFGVVAGLAYVGIACTPANLLLTWHMRFVQTAFRTFLVLVLCYGLATWRHPAYPRRYAVGWLAFAVLLAGYVWLLIAGPSARTPEGLLIQAAGQKIIVYASIGCVWWQCRGALQLATALTRPVAPATRSAPADAMPRALTS